MLFLQRVGVVVVSGLLMSSIALWGARASVDERVLAGSRAAFGFLSFAVRGAPQPVVLNGAQLTLATGRSELALSAVLDEAVAECRALSGGLAARAARVPAMRSMGSSLRDGILRAESSREGVVACLPLGARELSFEALAERLSRFAEEGDLALLGGLRFLRAERLARGTFFVSVRSDGPLRLWDMFPHAGEAPGRDPPGLPRPDHARRVLSAYQPDGAPMVVVYALDGSVDVDRAFARQSRAMVDAGYALDPRGVVRGAEQVAALYVRRGREVAVGVTRVDGDAFLALMPLDAGPGAAIARAEGAPLTPLGSY